MLFIICEQFNSRAHFWELFASCEFSDGIQGGTGNTRFNSRAASDDILHLPRIKHGVARIPIREELVKKLSYPDGKTYASDVGCERDGVVLLGTKRR